MKKISKTTMTAINRLSANTLEEQGVLIRARNSGYICPLCGNGEGKDGTGIKPYVTDSHVGWKCFKCGERFNNLRILSAHYELDRQTDFNSLVEKICGEFDDVPLEYVDFDNPKRTHRRRKKTDVEPIDPKELKLIHEDLQHDKERLRFAVGNMEGKKWRGFDTNFLLKHGCRVISGWASPESRVKGTYSTPTDRMLIPCSKDGYLARLIPPVKFYTDEHGNNYVEGKEKMHAGRKSLFNADALDTADPVFCLEGYIDAMSCELAGFKAVALGGADRGDLIVDAVAGMSKKPQVVIMLDSDDTGRKVAPELYAALISVGCPCCIRFLTDVESKLDCNQILVEQGIDNLRGRLQEIIDDSLGELATVAEELAKKKQTRLTDDDLNFLFEGDETDSDFANRFEKVFGARVRWLTDEERWLTYGNGLWQHGSEKNSCLLPFVRETKDLMLEYAENKEERVLAERLKSTRKILSSITMMKSLDSILITTKDLDAHSELLNCLNGVVDLETGTLMDADPSLLITKQCNCAFEPNAQSSLVDKFFRDIMPDDETRAGLLRWLGYCLTAKTNEHKFAVWTGEHGANGKSTLSGVMLKLLGTYGTGLNPRALLKSNRPADGNSATTGLNCLEGVRFALAEELPLNAEVDSSLIKTLSGGDQINLRQNFCEFRTITNFAKINISGNYLPRLENVNDNGVRRRLLNFAFNVQFGTPEHPADPQLKEKLFQPENLNALLALLVHEAVAWYRGDGLIISDAMKAETQRLLDESNFVADFISDYYVKNPNAHVNAKEFLEHLKRECPRETAQFNKRADLIKLITAQDGVTYDQDSNANTRIFKCIGKLARDSQLDGEPVGKDVAIPS